MNTLISDLTTILPPGFPRPSAVFYHDDRLYIGGRTAPAWLASLRASDLGDFKCINFPVENNPSSNQVKYTVVLKLLWFKDRLHVMFSGSSQLTIAEVDPEKWTWKDVISTVRGNDVLSMWNDGEMVYASGFGQDVTIGDGVISYFKPPVSSSPNQPMNEFLIPKISSQYAPLFGAAGFLYYVNGDGTNGGEMMVARFDLPDGALIMANTPGIRWFGAGPDVVEFGDFLYCSFMSCFFGNDFGVPNDTLFRVNKTTLLVDKLLIDGPSKGAVWDFWADADYLWILRTSTLSRYDGTTFVHYDLGTERPELIVGDNAGHLFGIERTNPVIVRRYTIAKPEPKPALIVSSDATSLTFTDGQSKWRVPIIP